MKKFLIIVMLLLLLPMAHAVKTQISTGDETLEIRVPAAEYIKKNLVGKLHLHVFNKTSGMLMTNDTTSCLLHIYNGSGSHIVQAQMSFDTNLIDFQFDINSSIFSSLGLYSYIVGCNTSTNGGFIAGGVTVTQDGLEPQDTANIGWTIVALIGAAFILCYSCFKMESTVLKMLFFFVMMLFIVITLSIAVALPNVSLSIINTLEIAYLIAITITIFSFIFTIILFIYEIMVGKKAEEMREQEE